MGFLGLSDVRRFSAIQMRRSTDDDRRFQALAACHSSATNSSSTSSRRCNPKTYHILGSVLPRPGDSHCVDKCERSFRPKNTGTSLENFSPNRPNSPKNSEASVLRLILRNVFGRLHLCNPTAPECLGGCRPGQLSLHQDGPLAHVAPDMALVRTVAVAINPVDAKMLDYSPAVGAIHGCDFAGVIVALGSDARVIFPSETGLLGPFMGTTPWSPMSVPLHSMLERPLSCSSRFLTR